MKNIYTLSILLVLSLSSFAKTYYIYTAKTSGNWDNSGTWNAVVRNDNVQKDKFIIPSAFTVTADEDVNDLGYDDVEMQISGVLDLGPSTVLYLGANSSIQILSTGSIEGNGASQQIYIGNVPKYVGNKNKTLTGPVFADMSTPAAPNGFSAFALLAVTPDAAILPAVQRNEKSTVVYSSNKTININFKEQVKSTVAVNLVNMNGDLVASSSYNKPATKLSLNMSNLNSGIYIVYITENNATTVKKIYLN